jgi:hypothetical protein
MGRGWRSSRDRLRIGRICGNADAPLRHLEDGALVLPVDGDLSALSDTSLSGPLRRIRRLLRTGARGPVRFARTHVLASIGSSLVIFSVAGPRRRSSSRRTRRPLLELWRPHGARRHFEDGIAV